MKYYMLNFDRKVIFHMSNTKYDFDLLVRLWGLFFNKNIYFITGNKTGSNIQLYSFEVGLTE